MYKQLGAIILSILLLYSVGFSMDFQDISLDIPTNETENIVVINSTITGMDMAKVAVLVKNNFGTEINLTLQTNAQGMYSAQRNVTVTMKPETIDYITSKLELEDGFYEIAINLFYEDTDIFSSQNSVRIGDKITGNSIINSKTSAISFIILTGIALFIVFIIRLLN